MKPLSSISLMLSQLKILFWDIVPKQGTGKISNFYKYCSITESVSERQDVSPRLVMLDAQGASIETGGITSVLLLPLFPTGLMLEMLFDSLMFPFKICVPLGVNGLQASNMKDINNVLQDIIGVTASQDIQACLTSEYSENTMKTCKEKVTVLTKRFRHLFGPSHGFTYRICKH